MMAWLETLRSVHIGVVGDVMLDRAWSGAARRISPEAPVPIVSVRETAERLGGAANVAANVAALGARVTLLGVTGDDAAANILEALCRAQRIEAKFIRVSALPTTVKLRVLAQHQQLIRLDFEDEAAAMHGATLEYPLNALLREIDVVIFSDYAKGALHEIRTLLHGVKAAGKLALVDPKGVDFSKYAGADLLTPNLSEFEAVVGRCRDARVLTERAVALCREHAFGAVLVTRGEQGMSLVRSTGAAVHLPAQARDVFDVTGAGDTVCAALAAAIASHLTLEQAVEIANTAAGIAVGKLGTAVVTAAELSAAVAPRAPPTSQVLTLDEAMVEVRAARQRGERIVMTNGCFDVLHAGHVRYLEAAAALGTRLLVAVNSDESVRRLKGPGRPLNPLGARAEVLAALRAVDWVVAFETDTPQPLIAQVLPDVLVKGGDYQVEQIAGAADVIKAGGRVTTVPFHRGYSSSGVIAAAQSLAEPMP